MGIFPMGFYCLASLTKVAFRVDPRNLSYHLISLPQTFVKKIPAKIFSIQSHCFPQGQIHFCRADLLNMLIGHWRGRNHHINYACESSLLGDFLSRFCRTLKVSTINERASKDLNFYSSNFVLHFIISSCRTYVTAHVKKTRNVTGCTYQS